MVWYGRIATVSPIPLQSCCDVLDRILVLNLLMESDLSSVRTCKVERVGGMDGIYSMLVVWMGRIHLYALVIRWENW